MRSVSQALQRLPRKQLGEDLSAAILERTRQAPIADGPIPTKPTANYASAAGKTHASFSIGRTRRGWLWAALAVAAALAMMFLQHNPANDKQLPTVASKTAAPPATDTSHLIRDEFRDRQSASETEKLAEQPAPLSPSSSAAENLDRERAFKSVQRAPAATAPPTAADQPEPPGIVRLSGDRSQDKAHESLLGEGRQPGASDMPPRDAGLQAYSQQLAQNSGDQSGSASDAGGASRRTESLGVADGVASASGNGTMPPPAMMPAAAPSSAVSQTGNSAVRRGDVLVVYVDVTPAALQQRAIDGKLASVGLNVEAIQTAAIQGLDRSQDAEQIAAPRDLHLFDLGSRLATSEPSPTDAILVDAPAAQVTNLLAALDADRSDVVRISVEDGQLTQRIGGTAEPPSLANIEWSRMKRVSLPDEMMRRLNRSSEPSSTQVADSFGVSTPSNEPLRGVGRGGARGAGGGRGGGGGGFGGGGGAGGGRGGRRAGRGAQPPAIQEETQSPGAGLAGGEVSADDSMNMSVSDSRQTRGGASAEGASGLKDEKAIAVDADRSSAGAMGGRLDSNGAAAGEGAVQYGFPASGGGQASAVEYFQRGLGENRGEAQVSSGRAYRLTVSLSAGKEAAVATSLAEFKEATESLKFDTAQIQQPGDVQVDMRKAVDAPSAQSQQQAVPSLAATGRPAQSSVGPNGRDAPAGQVATREIRDSGATLNAQTPDGVRERVAQQLKGVAAGSNGIAAQEPSGTLQVLLVVRAAPSTVTTAPAPASETASQPATSQPATSLPADDKAK